MEVLLESEPDDLDLPAHVEREIYYVLREALTNVTRHAHASRVTIQLSQTQERIEGSIEDNGVGADLTKASNGAGIGMASMRDRIEKKGGGLEVRSSPGSGYRIRFSVPLDLPNKAAVNQ